LLVNSNLIAHFIQHRPDFIIIDYPPTLNIFTTNALLASDLFIIALQPEASALYGVDSLFNRIHEVREESILSLIVKGILFTMVTENTLVCKQMMDFVKNEYKHIPIFNKLIERATVVQQSQVAQKDIFTYSPKSLVAQKYTELAKEFFTI
jgi:chromosome partitioning protein